MGVSSHAKLYEALIHGEAGWAEGGIAAPG